MRTNASMKSILSHCFTILTSSALPVLSDALSITSGVGPVLQKEGSDVRQLYSANAIVATSTLKQKFGREGIQKLNAAA